MILALDLGMTTGWALMDGCDDIALSGVWRLPSPEVARGYVELYGEVDELLVYAHLLAYEDVPASAHRGGDAAHRWGGFEAIVLSACYRHRTQYLGVKPAQWKRAAGLRSGSGEDDALRAAQERWPDRVFASPDEAVARWVAIAAASRVW